MGSLVAACGNLVPWPGVEPVPLALGAQSLSHWTTREVPLKEGFTSNLSQNYLSRGHFLLRATWRTSISQEFFEKAESDKGTCLKDVATTFPGADFCYVLCGSLLFRSCAYLSSHMRTMWCTSDKLTSTTTHPQIMDRRQVTFILPRYKLMSGYASKTHWREVSRKKWTSIMEGTQEEKKEDWVTWNIRNTVLKSYDNINYKTES